MNNDKSKSELRRCRKKTGKSKDIVHYFDPTTKKTLCGKHQYKAWNMVMTVKEVDCWDCVLRKEERDDRGAGEDAR